MLKVHTSDGKTHKIDLSDENQANEFLTRMRSRAFQATITGISVVGSAGTRVKCPCCKQSGFLTCSSCQNPVPADFRTSVGVQYSLTKPDGFVGPVHFLVENVPSDPESGIKGGERVICFAGETRTQMMIHAGQPSARIAVSRIGNQRFNPFLE